MKKNKEQRKFLYLSASILNKIEIFNVAIGYILKIHSFLKQCCVRSSFYENKLLHLMSAEEGFVKVPCLHKMKIAQTLF